MPTNQTKKDQYLVNTLFDGLSILRRLMENLSPFTWYSINDLIAEFPDQDYQKMYRLCYTMHAAGFMECRDKKYRLSEELYLLSHRYLQALNREHERIKTEILKFTTNRE